MFGKFLSAVGFLVLLSCSARHREPKSGPNYSLAPRAKPWDTVLSGWVPSEDFSSNKDLMFNWFCCAASP